MENMLKGKEKRKLLAFCIAFLAVFIFTQKAYAEDQTLKVYPAYETNPAFKDSTAKYAVVGIQGHYSASIRAWIDRINEIRLEACKEGVRRPGDEGGFLTESDYTPIQWSADLEQIAMVRAVEASMAIGHDRPNGLGCFTVKSESGFGSSGECLAWNGVSNNPEIFGINQWYGEKSDWVGQVANSVTGHYTAMINPDNRYVGLACFYCPYADYRITLSGEFSGTIPKNGAGTAFLSNDTETRIQQIEVLAQEVSDLKLSIEGNEDPENNPGQAGGSAKCKLTGKLYKKHSVPVGGKLTWSSSDPKVAKVDQTGTVTYVSGGKTVISVVSDGGLKASITVSVEGNGSGGESGSGSVEPGSGSDKPGNGSGKGGQTTDKPASGSKSVGATGFTGIKAKKKALSLKWKSVEGASGYEIAVSTVSSFDSGKTKIYKISKALQLSKTIKKLKSRKKFFVRIRAFKTDASGNKAYGKWSKTKKKKTK